jgi:transposase
VISTLRDGTNPPVRALFDRLKEKGKHQKVAEVACMGKLLEIVYGCWSKGEWFDPTFEKRLKARQKEKSGSTERTDDGPVQEGDLTAPISRREAKRRRKATSPQKSGSSSERGQGAFP